MTIEEDLGEGVGSLGYTIVLFAIWACILIASVGMAWWMVRGTYLYFFGG